MSLPPRQQEILKHVIAETERSCAPTLARLAECAGVSYAIARAALIGLQKKGYVEQPYKSGPYIPLKDIRGNGLQWGLIKKAA